MPAIDPEQCRVGAVVLHHQYWPGILDTIDALVGQDRPPARIVVVDNGGTEHLERELTRTRPEIEVVALSENRGYAAGMNAGVRALGAEWDAFLLVTHECRLEPSALRDLVGRLSEAPHVGAIGPLLVWADEPARVWSAGGTMVDRRRRLEHVNRPADAVAWRTEPARPVDWIDGACVLIRGTAMREVGALDERYFLYYEEADYMLRLRAAGWSVECLPAAVAYQSSSGVPVYLMFRNRIRFVARWAAKSLPAEIFHLLKFLLHLVRRSETRPAAVPAARGLVAGFLGRTGPPKDHRVLAVRIDPEWRGGLRLGPSDVCAEDGQADSL